MATNAAPEQTLFVRKASGLVKGWSGGDGFRYSFFSVNLFLAIWSFAYATFFPEGSLFWSIVITAIFIVLGIISSTPPRSPRCREPAATTCGCPASSTARSAS